MKKLLALFLAFVMVVSVFLAVPFTVSAKEIDVAQTSYTSGDYTYEVLSDGTAEITRYKGSDTEHTIPSTIDGYDVTSIGVQAFYYCKSLESITIPGGVTSIGNYAFNSCHSLTSINIPESVVSIGDSTFSNCYSLTSINIPESVVSIGNGAFSDCDNLTSINIPESVVSIGNYAFSDCNNLAEIIVDSNNEYYDSRENCNAIIETETNTLIYGCKNTVIPSTVTSIGDRAFSFYSLTSIAIPEGVTSIGDSAFSNCYSLTSINIPESVVSIGDYAFNACENLTSINIPESVVSIGYGAFEFCEDLELITIYSKDCIIGDYSIPFEVKIYCYENSTAHTYAVDNGNKYEFITDVLAILGDVDGDDKVSIMDATEIQRHIAQLTTISEDRLTCADTDKDGKVSIIDATQIQRFIAQLIPEL